MATIENRSRFRVTVKNRDDLTKSYSYNKLKDVESYMHQLRAQGLKPRAAQLDEHWLVRIRQTGYKPLESTFSSQAVAETFDNKTTEERSRGLFVDYTKAHKGTFAELLVRYLQEEAPKHKSGKILAYKIEGWLEDSGERGRLLLEQLRQSQREKGLPVRSAKFKMRSESGELEWIHKRLSEVTTVDVEQFVSERLDEVAAATVDREIDILLSVFKVAINVWDYNLAKNPMVAVRRPKYFNERDRRLTASEEERLLQALARLDLVRAAEPILHGLAEDALAGTSFTSASARKKELARVRIELRASAEDRAFVVPYLQTFYLFQVMTGARRSEALGLTWERIDFERGTAFLPDTKNGRSRKLSLRAGLLELLAQLPRDTERVFAVGVDHIVGAWAKACEMADIKDLHIHDLRHEAISRIAETGRFTLPELQQFSGHRDIRMLMRYAHLCASRLAKKLDECFKDEVKMRVHRGRKMLGKQAGLTVREVIESSEEDATGDERDPSACAAVNVAEEPHTSAKVFRFPIRKTA
ncbi:MAG: site-specific integrase [Rhodoferax sp.]